MWFCPGANHAPHQAPQEYIDKYKGVFDDGYEAYREWVLARMVERGVVPEGTELTPLNPMPQDVANEDDHVRPWAELNDDEKKLFCRMAEVFAGFSEYTDVQIGRIVEFLERTGQLDNTLIFYCADNGASGEGTPNGSVNENKFFNGYPDGLEENMSYFDEFGGPKTSQPLSDGVGGGILYAVSDVQALRTVRRRHLRPDGHPLAQRHQGQGRDAPPVPPQHGYRADHSRRRGPRGAKVYRGVEQYPLNGVSMRYSFDDAHAPTTKKRQYFAMLGTRGIWQDGWKAATLHAPISGKGHFDQDRWELYHVDEDRSEARNLAEAHPEKLQELIDVWFAEAEANSVLPLDDRPPAEVLNDDRPQGEPPRSRYIYYPDTTPVPESNAGQHPRSVVQDPRRRGGDVRFRGCHLRAWLAIRRAHPLHQGPQTALRVQLPGHQTRADLRLS